MPIVVPHKPGVQEWWQDARERDLVLKLEGVFKEEKAYLPPKMLRCLSGTDNLEQMLTQGRKGRMKRKKEARKKCRCQIEDGELQCALP